jgi:hypothetical protein
VQLGRSAALVQEGRKQRSHMKKPRLTPQHADLIERLARFAQNVTIILGVFAGVLSFIASQHDKRVASVLDLRREYTGDIRGNFLQMMDSWNTLTLPDGADFLKLKQGQQAAVVLNFFKDTKNRQPLNQIIDFFDTLYACLNRHACDRNTALYLFQDVAKQSFETGGYHIMAKRTNDGNPGYAHGLENIYSMNPELTLSSYF